jgi:hypothetical protein
VSGVGWSKFIDAILFGSRRPALRDRLAASSSATRALLSSATVLVLVAALLAIAATRARPQRAIRQVTDPTVPTAQSVDATGCPVGMQCVVRPEATAALTTAVHRVFGNDVAVLSASETMAAGSSRLYETEMIASVPVGRVRVAASCVPGAPRVQGSFEFIEFGHDDMAGNRRTDYRRVVIVEPGATGCSVVVKLDATGSRTEVVRLARALALDPSLQVPT